MRAVKRGLADLWIGTVLILRLNAAELGRAPQAAFLGFALVGACSAPVERPKGAAGAYLDWLDPKRADPAGRRPPAARNP